ncbi:hypothetical protein ASE94_11845 [Devosia sp. Leaf64]|jgi:uncharacterized SAM-binding protein YcdF (DUF218 family)|uniref:YdcF family protein n=1 Tax=Devosia sp. Leaf420 TaxID=1736374 RepID=UPI0007142467|nr:YdcF family protein [Devosia sp. Leaf420]KQN69788.1 hypothetical protein ASE94_11845 [Devosia sp. Leaf64]KQT45905.1 hypothetical protein ASG47_13245 [Devosia sp. Leaf420]
MFFLVSKIFWLVAQPSSIVVLLLLLALGFALLRKRKSSIAALVLAVLVHGLVGYTTLGYVIIQPLEDRFSVPATPPQAVNAIIMLGGATLARPSSARQIAELNDAGDRLTTTLWLANAYPTAKIVVSGGSGVLDDEGESEAETAKRFFSMHGISEDRFILEGESRNTDENVAFTESLLGDLANGNVILVTSAFHMPRSVGIFSKAGLRVIPWPTDYRTPGPQGLWFDIANPVQNLNVTTVAIKEWIGLAVYYWTGKTTTFLPQQ